MLTAATDQSCPDVLNLIAQDANLFQVDDDGYTFLHQLAFHQLSECVTSVADVADPTDLNALLNTQEATGASPMVLAARSENIELAQLLLDIGSDLELVNPDGQTFLMTACVAGASTVVEFALSNGADVTSVRRQCDPYGRKYCIITDTLF